MPIYMYECPKGHTWDEIRTYVGSEFSDDSCEQCRIAAEELGDPITEWQREEWQGKKVVAPVNTAFHGTGWTPKFFPNQKGK